MNGPSDPGDAAGSSESFQQNNFVRQFSKASLCETDEEQDDGSYVPGPLVSLKEQLELDKEDESLRRWKEKLLGCVDYDFSEESMEPEVTFQSLGIISSSNQEVNFSLLLENNGISITLKEGCNYYFKFSFMVHHNIVSGLQYVNTVWKAGLKVDHIHHMLGTFSPRQEPYVHALEEETTPSGVLARGTYTAKTKFIDDDGRCHLEVDYSFEIQKDR
ncbi:hypothetical protein SUGI_1139230 [Cryptomeria japonica]|nr:rho GDP-dissociation inhibitor 1 isoform X2 [Cryptomeria japonica]XP_057858746.2 rho GDP-dissociation inhibitor 1 isoform X2 [Cryptomeria japonica]XP_057858747.2 rho GDP-dissociation inhibitor 1 isoform X2 [Cryptomeria japonica]XP_057858748.2 rho GDP-dissociation inhibitor 1 isoform X2 [Cryptomeria japonica]XP_057858749.2 rho GDP-dissociation inhibitor 1 isoform X2 [Cryptomeria japonica]XP_057858750.2 rho GDP-dissociation inhibitor 1 isoform X2 [Cryptomeria japonica]XP_057858751.2 rho GDP-